jgi:hypothetical protein
MQNQKANIKGELNDELIKRMERFRSLHKEKASELMNLTGVDGMVTLAYDEKTGIHIFPTDNISPETAADMICQVANAILNGPQMQKAEEQMELPLDS